MKKLIAANIVAAFCATNAHAFGINDLIGIGIQAGGEILRAAGGKAVDAIKESMRDPEAEAREKAEQERKLAEQMQKQIDEIEAMPNLRPIERERLVLALKKQYAASKEMQAFIERAEAQQKAERDKLLTLGGVAGSIGRAALSTPGMALAQADLMAKNPVWRAQQRLNNEAIFRQADAQVAAGIPQAKARLALAQADVLQKSGIQQAGSKAVVKAAEEMARQGVRKEDVEKAAEAAGQTAQAAGEASSGEPPAGATNPDGAAGADGTQAGTTAAAPSGTAPDAGALPPKDAFSPDLGKKVWIEFVGSPAETARLRNRLQALGHTLAASREEAEVVYLVEGEYAIPETKSHEGVTINLGELIDAPDKPIPAPSKKLSGTLASGVSKFLLVMASAQGQDVPADALPKDGVFRQEALLVIARQPKEGKETRFSVVKTVESADLMGAKLAVESRDNLYAALGLTEPGAGLPENAKK